MGLRILVFTVILLACAKLTLAVNIWYANVEKGSIVKVDTDRYDDPTVLLTVTWSPDSKWLTYSKFLENHLRSIFVYSLDTKKASQIHRGAGRCALPGVRQRRQGAVLHRKHRRGTFVRVAGSFQLPTSRVAQRLCGGAEKRVTSRRLNPRATKRRRRKRRRPTRRNPTTRNRMPKRTARQSPRKRTRQRMPTRVKKAKRKKRPSW
jgi:hypothetical protein